MLFNIAKLGNLNKPLTVKILSNPEHAFTKHLVYLYSMESFIYPDMNRACREKDESKIQFYGAFAAALSFIIYFANKNRKNEKLHGNTKLYRGLKLSMEEVEAYRLGRRVSLVGYQSTSKSLDIAIRFACMDLKEH